jgi:hypothetical protein
MENKVKYGPSAEEMREFATKFTPEEWALCCNYDEFLDGVSYDLKEAGLVAMLVFMHYGMLEDGGDDSKQGEMALV